MKTKRETLSELREWIEDYKRHLLEIEELKDKIVQVLTLRDKIKNLLEKLEKKGADLSAEKSKLDSLDQIIKDKPQVVWKRLKNHIDPVLYRKEHKISPEHWWWYLDEIIKKEKEKLTRRWIKRAIVGAVVIISAYLFFVYFLPKPDPYISCIQKAEQLLEEGKINPALETYQRAIKIDPEKPFAYMMTGVIYQFLEEKEKAKKYFSEARKRYSSLYDFYLQRGMSWMKLGKFTAAQDDAEKALKINPKSARAHFLLGSAYEAQNKIPEAIAEFSIVSKMESDPKLTVIARYKIGMLALKKAASKGP